jgi:Co/Zn/Cd efflux system component
MAWIHNYQGGDTNDQTGTVIAIHILFPLLAFLAVCFRFLTRRWTGYSLWVDDYVALATAILILIRAGLVIAQTRWGLGLSEEYFAPENAAPFSKVSRLHRIVSLIESVMDIE